MAREDFSSIPPYSGGPLAGKEILARFRQVAATELLRHALPKSFGGFGDGFGELYQAHRRLGEASFDPGLVLMVNAHLWGAVFPILRHGEEAQREQFLAPLIRGELLAGHAITEAGAGSDVQAMASTAEPGNGGFLLNGEKRYVTNAPLADRLVVYAKLEGRITAFIVSRHDVGYEVDSEKDVQTCRGSSIGRVLLRDCQIGRDRLLGRPGAGGSILQQALELERAFVFAGIAGVMARQLALAVTHSRDRRAGGSHLGKHQAISHRIADMKLRLDTVDLWLRECARLADASCRLSQASAETKLYAAEAFLQSSLDAVQIFGALGLESETGLVNLVNDALAGRLFSGSSEIQKNIIAALLGTGEGFRGNRDPDR